MEANMQEVEPGVWKCLICDNTNNTFHYRNNLRNHIKNQHQGDQFLSCVICSKTLKNKEVLRVHFSKQHKEEIVQVFK